MILGHVSWDVFPFWFLVGLGLGVVIGAAIYGELRALIGGDK